MLSCGWIDCNLTPFSSFKANTTESKGVRFAVTASEICSPFSQVRALQSEYLQRFSHMKMTPQKLPGTTEHRCSSLVPEYILGEGSVCQTKKSPFAKDTCLLRGRDGTPRAKNMVVTLCSFRCFTETFCGQALWSCKKLQGQSWF